MFDFLQRIVAYFNKYNIPYMLSGSIAMGIYVIPRATKDIDFVVNLHPDHIDELVDYFAEGYYCSKDAVADAVKRYSIFNIIDHTSGYKADFVILKNTEYRRTEFERRQTIELYGIMIDIVSAEDLLISKLIWIQEFQSALQLEDIKNLLAMQGLEMDYVSNWTTELKLNTFNLMPNG